ncbi:MAG: serine/threonine-protein kinase [Planctomycetota bacterium]
MIRWRAIAAGAAGTVNQLFDSPMPRPERLGPYRIGEPLGKGGMGYVYAATHEHTGDRVAVKALSPELAMAEGFCERFEAEIESLRKLRHLNIVELFGYGEDAGTHFYAMELVDGASLEEELRAGRRFYWREVTQIAIQVCRALKHAHDHGVIHRDIKPANILLDREETVKLADFGIARLFGATQLTTAGGILGTADFMAPEQADGRPVTDRCDQYALGSVMYALLAGRPPFRAKTLPEMLQLQRFANPEPIRRYAPQTPIHLEKVIDQLLAKAPNDRFPNTLVLARHLEAMVQALSRPAADDFLVDDRDGDAGDSATPNGESMADMTMTRAETRPGGASRDPREADAAGTPAGRTSASGIRSQPTRVAPADNASAENTNGANDPTDAGRSDLESPEAAGGDSPTHRFTVVGEGDDEPEPQGAGWAAAAQLALFLLLLAGAGGVAYFMMQPPSADALYASLSAVSEEEWERGDKSAREDLESFLRRFPDDPRAESLRDRSLRVADSKLGRRLRAASLRNDRFNTRLSPGERLYVEALRLEKTSQAAARERYTQLVVLLDLPLEDAGDERVLRGQLLALAKQQLGRLKQRGEAAAERSLPFAQSRLESARAIGRDEPQKAAGVCRALIAVYGDRPWAEGVVSEARELLESLEEPSNAASSPP